MTFSTRYSGEYNTELWLDLKGTSSLWSATELDRCVQRAVDDLSRHYPLEVAYEHTINYTVSDESSVAPVAGTWKALAYKPIRVDSEVVTNSTGAITYTKDTDYTMDYINGKYTIITGGGITATNVLIFDYYKSLLGIDLSAIITNLLRVSRVEYPGSMVPQQFVNFSIWNNFMYIGSQGTGKSQAELTDKEHVVIYYEAPHTAPGTATAPSYPAFLDEVVCIGAAGYAMYLKSIQCEHQAITDLASMRTELGLTTAVHTLVGIALGAAITQEVAAATALAKVATYLETNSNYSAKLVLEDISTTLHSDTIVAAKHADAVLTQLATALSISEADVNAVYTEQKKWILTSGANMTALDVQALLGTGDDYINKANLGARVAEIYGEYANISTRIAEMSGLTGTNLVSFAQAEASTISAIAQSMGAVAQSLGAAAAAADALIANNGSYVEESLAWTAIAQAFVNEATQRIASANGYVSEAETELAEIDRYLAEAERYRTAVDNDMTLSDRFRVEGQQRLNDFQKILESRAQYRKRTSSVPVIQPA